MCVIVFSAAGRVSAQEASYKIHDAGVLPAPTVSGVGRVVDWGLMYIPYTGGSMVLGAAPDGSGAFRIGDMFELIITSPTGKSRRYQYSNYNAWCSPVNAPVSPQTVGSEYFSGPGEYNITWRYIDYCGGAKQVDSLYLVARPVVPTVTPSPTVTPTPTPTPTPAGPEPFLRLPWDYSRFGLSFGEAALRMSAYFDHEYPLLSSGTKEQDDTKNTVVTFKNESRTNEPYSSHDGYDYAYGARARLGEPVLAAAAGRATYMKSCPACGNAILIDHGNHYQTRYYHLGLSGLVTDDPSMSVNVAEGQQIGIVGATGNVLPPGDRGAHIHFMVVEDRDRDGSFEDDIPGGVTDPYGWKLAARDPWEAIGNKSHYLWKDPLEAASESIVQGGGTVSLPHVTFTFNPDSYPGAFTFSAQRSTPVTYGDTLASIGNTIIAQAVAGVDTFVTQFHKFYSLEIDFSGEDLSAFDPSTLAIYSSEDGTVWVREDTEVDFDTMKATSRINHLSRFALMGERKDDVAPTVEATLSGTMGKEHLYRSGVGVELTFRDGDVDTSAGKDYILYRLDGGDWDAYSNPLRVADDGTHTVEYYAADRAGNIGDVQSVTFTIDTNIPEAVFVFDPMSNRIEVRSDDDNARIDRTRIAKRQSGEKVTITDDAGNVLTLEGIFRNVSNRSKIRILTMRYGDDEKVTVPHTTLEAVFVPTSKKKRFSSVQQGFKVKDELKLGLHYSSKSDTTRIVTNVKGVEKTIRTVDGMKILQVFTDRGTVKYAY